MPAKKIALVLSGGAFSGAFQLGALRYIRDHWKKIVSPEYGDKMKFDLVTGVSVGTLNGIFIASERFDELEAFWQKVSDNGVEEVFTSNYIDTKSNADTLQFKIRISCWKVLKLILSKKFRNQFVQKTKSIADNTPLLKKIQDTVRRQDFKCEFKCGMVSLDDSHYYSFGPEDFDQDADFHNAILASTAMPIIWDPVKEVRTKKITIKNAVDGGVRTVVPLGDAIDQINQDTASEYTVIIVTCCNQELEKADLRDSNIAQIALRSLDLISQNEIINNDMESFLRINDILDQVRTNCKIPIEDYDYNTRSRIPGKFLKEFRAILIEPDPYTMGDELVATKYLIQSRINCGLQKAEEALRGNTI
jgi:NTE family protein